MDTKMPWGRYRGEDISNINSPYLMELLEEHYANLTLAFRQAIRSELIGRFGLDRGTTKVVEVRVPGPPINLREKVSQVRRLLAWKYHPDRGGNTEIMKGINLALDELTK